MNKQFGANPSESDLKRYATSRNWDGKKFVNYEETAIKISFPKFLQLFYKQLFERDGRKPKTVIPVVPFDKENFLSPAEKTKFVWYGHSVVLMRMNGKTLLIDPMLGPDTAPVSPFPIKRFSDKTLDIIDEFPEIDLLLLTHDHYDHLDYASIQKLKPKVKKYYVALGLARHLVSWGIPAEAITEFDWWDKATFEDIHITFTPTRHFSGRGLRDRSQSLWGGWVFKTANENIWFSGDGGYGKHFKEIGQQLGPFDFAFMECGQYNENWHLIHMYPEESVQAAIDVQVQKIMPVHWAGFALSVHPWTEPVERFIVACEQQKVPFITPKKGEIISLADEHKNAQWWTL